MREKDWLCPWQISRWNGPCNGFSPHAKPQSSPGSTAFSSICGKARLRQATEGGREMWGWERGQLPKITHIQSFWPEHLNIKTNQLQLTSTPVSRQQQELIKMKSFPLSPPGVCIAPMTCWPAGGLEASSSQLQPLTSISCYAKDLKMSFKLSC